MFRFTRFKPQSTFSIIGFPKSEYNTLVFRRGEILRFSPFNFLKKNSIFAYLTQHIFKNYIKPSQSELKCIIHVYKLNI